MASAVPSSFDFQNVASDFYSHQPLSAPQVHQRGGVVVAPSQNIGSSTWGADDDYSNEPPLLEELGINFEHIWRKVYAVLMLQKDIDPVLMRDSDMAGPLVFCLALGFCLLLTGKVHFGYIYGFGAMGCIAMYVIVNLMAQSTQLDLSRTFSVMGYCLLPIVMLSAIAIVVNLRGTIGTVLGSGAVIWCTLSSARFFDATLGMREQKWLIAYPACLLYACFALITIF